MCKNERSGCGRIPTIRPASLIPDLRSGSDLCRAGAPVLAGRCSRRCGMVTSTVEPGGSETPADPGGDRCEHDDRDRVPDGRDAGGRDGAGDAEQRTHNDEHHDVP